MAHDVFISYSSIDKDAAEAVCSVLEENGIKCWIAPRDETPGLPFAEAIIDGIKAAKVFVLIYSSNSNHSPQVIKEVDRAVHHGLSIINLRLDDEPLSKKLEYYISDVHWLDALTLPLEQHMNKLCTVIKLLLGMEVIDDKEIGETLRKRILKQHESADTSTKSRIEKRKKILVSSILSVVAIAIASLIIFNIGDVKHASAGSIESVVVLPFYNYTGDEELETQIAGMHACLITDIGRLSGLRVINSTTSRTFKNTGMSVPAIASDLNVDAVIEVSLLGFQDTIVIQVSLIQAFPEQETVWATEYKEEKRQLMNLYNRITRQIADEVNINVTASEEQLLARSRIHDPEAVFAYIQGKLYWDGLQKEDLDSASHYFSIAIAKDPDWADPYAGMALVWVGRRALAYAPLPESNNKIYEYLNRALERDPDAANLHFVKAMNTVWHEWNWEEGEKEFLKALEINPNDALCRVYYAHFLALMQRMEEAVDQADLAVSLDPLRPIVLALSANLIAFAGQYQDALDQAEKAVNIDPENGFAIGALRDAYIVTGDTLRWYELLRSGYQQTDEDYLGYLDSIFQKGGYQSVTEERIRRIEEVYSQGGNINYFEMARFCFNVRKWDMGMDYLEEGYELHAGMIAYATAIAVAYPEMKNNPRYIALLKKMNLPLPETD